MAMQKLHPDDTASLYEAVARYAKYGCDAERPLHPSRNAEQLRAAFAVDLSKSGRPPLDVIHDLIAAAEPGLVGSTREGFLAWVIGGSHPAGIAADWLTALWGQNAGIYQASPAAAVAEEAVERWLLDLLGLPASASIGLVTGATMAGFVCLAAARNEVLRRVGYDLPQHGLARAPKTTVFLGAEAHSTIFAALRYLGFGEANFRRIPADRNGRLDTARLESAMKGADGPAIVIAQAGHINTGAFDSLSEIADIAHRHGAWLHIDGAFGLWARTVPELSHLVHGAELADSWSVDGHKWLQVPYDCGFAIVADRDAHRRAMDITAGYLPSESTDGRNPNHFGPELSRRARGFAVWAVLQTLGRDGITNMVRAHCSTARDLASELSALPEARIEHDVVLNQVTASFGLAEDDQTGRDRLTQRVCDELNATNRYFLKTADWRNHTVLRFSLSGAQLDSQSVKDLVREIKTAIDRCRAVHVSDGRSKRSFSDTWPLPLPAHVAF
ncbi:MAG: aspartate aminotransferase family protein [Rhizobiaceae bacterium]|nr:aspartate aminotransferase family protein [Rhizobiaceae bacterium]